MTLAAPQPTNRKQRRARAKTATPRLVRATVAPPEDREPNNLPPLPTGGIENSAVDDTPPDAPPAEKRGRGRPRGSGAGKIGDAEIIKGITQIYGTAGLLMYRANQYDGSIIIGNAETMATSLVEVSHRNKEFHRVLALIAAGNDISAVIMAHMVVAVAILANHKIVSANWPAAFGQPIPPGAVPATPTEQTMTQEQYQAYMTEQYLQQQAQQQAQAAAQFAGPNPAPPDERPADVAPSAPRVEYSQEQLQALIYQQAMEAQQQQQAFAQQNGSLPPDTQNPAYLDQFMERRG